MKAKVSCNHRPTHSLGQVGYSLGVFCVHSVLRNFKKAKVFWNPRRAPQGQAGYALVEFLEVVLHAYLRSPSYTPPGAGWPFPCGIPWFVFLSQNCSRKLRLPAITVLHHLSGQACYSPAEFLYVFCIRISERARKLRFSGIPVAHSPRTGGLLPRGIPIVFWFVVTLISELQIRLGFSAITVLHTLPRASL